MSSTTATHQRHSTRVEPASALERALNFDLARPAAFAVLALAYIASRAPFLHIGYGTDPDAWRIALSGHWLWDHGEFYPSRLPGYPIPELASAAVIKGGPVATNLLVVLVSLAGVWLFARIAAELRLPNRAMIVVAFAFTPLLWINSMTTMDYMWALTFLLASYYSLLTERSILAAVMLGLAAGSRSTSMLMAMPFVFYLWRDGKQHEVARFIGIAFAVTLVAYTPVMWKYGYRFLNVYDAKVGYLNVLRLLAKDCLGIIGALGVIVAASVSQRRLARLPGDALRDKNVAVWLMAIAITLIVFSALPHEAAYLLPLYPFGFLLMAKYFRTWALGGAGAALLIAGFADVTTPGDEITLASLADARPGRGLVLSNRQTMRAQLEFTRDLEELDVADNTVVLTGFVYPQFAVRNRDQLDVGILEKDRSAISQLSDKGQAVNAERRIVYTWLLDYDDFERFRSEGYEFAYTLDAGRSTAALYEYRPSIYGAALLDLGRAPSGGRGGARTDR